jgi:Calcineurin-like phosphoesterase
MRVGPGTSAGRWMAAVASAVLLTAACGQIGASHRPKPTPPPLVLAVIGDYGVCGSQSVGGPESSGACRTELAVADLVHSWHPADILTVGDNSYENGTCEEVQHDSTPFAADIAARRFFQVTGNHDWHSGQAGIDCATRYFGHPDHYIANFGQNLVDLFVVDANSNPDGCCPGSVQSAEYERNVGTSTATWKIEAQHQPRWASACRHVSSEWTSWVVNRRIDLYLAGHVHHMEHLVEGGQPFLVDGAGGGGLDRTCTPIPGSVWSNGQHYGAIRLSITRTSLLAEFIAVDGSLLHSLRLHKGG